MSDLAHFLVIGQGDIGLAVTNKLASLGKQVTGMARGESQDYQRHHRASFIQADAKQLCASQIASFSHIAIVVTPDEYNETAYKNTYLGIAEHIAGLADELPNLQYLIFISSTGVYGQDNGEWIDETVSPQIPSRGGSQYILQAEQVLQKHFKERAVIIRPSGIYGKERLMRVRKAQQKDKPIMPQWEWTNRILDTDLVQIITEVLLLASDDTKVCQLKPVYIATDYVPVTSYELSCWLCQQLATQPPEPEAQENESHAHPVMSGKRLHSNIPLPWLQYPDWHVGYRHILQSLDIKQTS
ncbi:NAD-dependent epimerase/dehydratase family protein [Psychrobacter sp. I-STPA6b]|uniref:NAD-dependent epimerase/dehydratase family protein n=1 Tax=Psychrobacter sp. I-STPA6b TaxID=2585718 RepID=UPI001D0CCB83|nr:NAD-dependent epimerase/dehydratase family protein [Psychrobacter sp. I-STPA6b]